MSICCGWYTTRKNKPFRLPTELDDIRKSGLPLYVLVAYWGLRQRKPVTVMDVRQAFGLSFRRAIDILEYITEQGEIVEVECNLRPLKPGDGRMRREWKVTTVYSERVHTLNESVRKTTVPSHGKNSCINNSINKLGRWFATRNHGGTVPEDLLAPD